MGRIPYLLLSHLPLHPQFLFEKSYLISAKANRIYTMP